jgi:hypothetical protein
MKILVSIASGSNNTERNILRSFFDGVERFYFQKFGTTEHKILKKDHGIDLRMSYDPEIEKCDIAVQFGTVKDRSAEHHITKQSIKKNSKTVIYVETPLLGRVISDRNSYAFYRIGVNGFLNNDGVFFHEERFDQTRLEKLKKYLTIPEFKGWKNHREGNILILCQLPGDASLRGQRMSEWLLDTLEIIRERTDRNILVRLHPAMSAKGKTEFYSEIGPVLFKNYKNLSWSDGSASLAEDLNSAGICVTYSSGSAIDAVLAGVPVIALDEGNLAYNISSHRLDDLDRPKQASGTEINQWLINLANSQWSENEILNSTVWNHLMPIIEQLQNESSDLP